MAHNVPVIAAAGGGPVEIIDNGRTGLLFAPDDIEQLLAAMEAVSHDRKLAHKLAANGRQHIISNFQADKTTGKIINVYKELTAA
jgi:glycosyltransferase involved in cell wall biosynthesis